MFNLSNQYVLLELGYVNSKITSSNSENFFLHIYPTYIFEMILNKVIHRSIVYYSKIVEITKCALIENRLKYFGTTA